MEYGDMTLQNEAVILPVNKIDLFAYDISTTGNLSITGIGFRPSSLIMFGIITTLGAGSWTFMNIPDGELGIHSQHEETPDRLNSSSQHTLTSDTNDEAYFNLVSMDIDGFTLSRTLNAAPSGTGHIRFMCFK